MRFRLTLSTSSVRGITIPLNYQYPLSAWIYKTIHSGDHAFAGFLHEKGFETGGKSFKLFTFSMLDIPHGKFTIQGDRLHITASEISLDISFLVPQAMQHFISGLFNNQRFRLGDHNSQADFLVSHVEMLAPPSFTEKMKFKTLSPLLVSHHIEGVRTAAYLRPGHDEYERLFFDNLTAKFAAALQAGLHVNKLDADVAPETMQLKLTTDPKTKGILIKADTPQQTKIIGYLFEFEITAPPLLIYTGYYAGFGEKNSLGLGCCAPLSPQHHTST
ncbi:MAG: CRISPR-associated endoribonuclease Cas6 [Bacteroidetes bacterium]|nr:CRISPR-associated endoribonuclease Cas6 [Bacteroidota bacterium]